MLAGPRGVSTQLRLSTQGSERSSESGGIGALPQNASLGTFTPAHAGFTQHDRLPQHLPGALEDCRRVAAGSGKHRMLSVALTRWDPKEGSQRSLHESIQP